MPRPVRSPPGKGRKSFHNPTPKLPIFTRTPTGSLGIAHGTACNSDAPPCLGCRSRVTSMCWRTRDCAIRAASGREGKPVAALGRRESIPEAAFCTRGRSAALRSGMKCSGVWCECARSESGSLSRTGGAPVTAGAPRFFCSVSLWHGLSSPCFGRIARSLHQFFSTSQFAAAAAANWAGKPMPLHSISHCCHRALYASSPSRHPCSQSWMNSNMFRDWASISSSSAFFMHARQRAKRSTGSPSHK